MYLSVAEEQECTLQMDILNSPPVLWSHKIYEAIFAFNLETHTYLFDHSLKLTAVNSLILRFERTKYTDYLIQFFGGSAGHIIMMPINKIIMLYMLNLFMLKARTVAHEFCKIIYFNGKEYSLKALSFWFQKIELT